ncbi:MAG TPA: hypothetical protein VEH06_01595 [Candidatus Bathyarchaeia archaeon]|nr:hypothetical protein [Candidatus Bathyarchaeia archaeon]
MFVANQETALPLGPHHRSPPYSPVTGYNGLGNYEEATRYLDKALAIDPARAIS